MIAQWYRFLGLVTTRIYRLLVAAGPPLLKFQQIFIAQSFACMQAFKTSGIWCVAGLRPVSKPWLWFLVHHAINIIGLVCLIFVKFVLYDLQFIMVNIYFIKTFYLRYFFVHFVFKSCVFKVFNQNSYCTTKMYMLKYKSVILHYLSSLHACVYTTNIALLYSVAYVDTLRGHSVYGFVFLWHNVDLFMLCSIYGNALVRRLVYMISLSM
jgi:hypothetical protein